MTWFEQIYDDGDFYEQYHDDTFDYDPIGNRKTDSVLSMGAKTYTTNALNQYTAVAGVGPTENFLHDADGNMTQDGTYTWDGEGERVASPEHGLFTVQTRLSLGANPTGPDNNDRKTRFKYDYLGRRVEREYQLYNGGTGTWTTQAGYPQRFVYDGWNPVLVLNGQSSNAVAWRFTWGLDLSGQQSRDRQGAEGIQGAGGIGGLLATAETGGTHQGTYWYLYDGRGNVVTVLSAAPG